MKIEKVSERTASVASRIYTLSWKIGYKGIIPQKYLDGLTAESWTPSFQKGVYKDYILEDNGEYVAASSVSPAREEEMRGWGEIVSLYVLPEYFRNGYGKLLFEHDVEQLKNDGFEKIYLWVLEENHGARDFYRAMSFFPNGNRSVINIGGRELTELRYVNRG